jgi:ribonuclease P protein component
MKRGKTISAPSFVCRFLGGNNVENNVENPQNGLKQGYFISALSPKAQFKTAVLRNRARRRMYGVINLLSHKPQKSLFKAVFIANKGIFDISPAEIQGQIGMVFAKLGV